MLTLNLLQEKRGFFLLDNQPDLQVFAIGFFSREQNLGARKRHFLDTRKSVDSRP